MDDETIRVTVSIGGTEVDPSETTIKAAMQRADEAMYRAKQWGRNRVEMETTVVHAPPAIARPDRPVAGMADQGTAEGQGSQEAEGTEQDEEPRPGIAAAKG